MNVQLHPNRRKFILRWCPIPIRTEAMRAELDALIEQEKSARVAELEAAIEILSNATVEDGWIQVAPQFISALKAGAK